MRLAIGLIAVSVALAQTPLPSPFPVSGTTSSGSVTSVGLAGTANQITVTGTSPITSSGSWTLSFPTNVTLPGNTTGTFIGNLTGTASTATNALSLGGNLAATYAPLASPTFTGTVTIGASLLVNTTALSTPSAPVLTIVGTPGSASCGYTVSAYNSVGAVSSTETLITNCPDTLDNTNKVSIAVAASAGATGINVYRTTDSTSFGIGRIGSLSASGGTIVDNRLADSRHLIPATGNTTQGMFDAYSITSPGRMLVGNLASASPVNTLFENAQVARQLALGAYREAVGDTGADVEIAVDGIESINLSANTSGSYYGGRFTLGTVAGNNHNFAAMYAGETVALFRSNGTVGHVEAGYDEADSFGSGSVQDLVVREIYSEVDGGSVIRWRGLKIDDAQFFGGTISGSAIGLDIGDWSSATSPQTLNIISRGASSSNLFEGNTHIGNGLTLQGANGSLLGTDIATPSNPSAGTTLLYAKSGTWCSLSPAGIESCPGGGANGSAGSVQLAGSVGALTSDGGFNWDSATKTLRVLDSSSLGSETLQNPTLDMGTFWTAQNDFALAADAATWTFSTGDGVVFQGAGDFAAPALPNAWYRFGYTVSAVSGSPSCAITTSFASSAVNLLITSGSQAVFFQASASPSDFVIECTGVSGAITFDDFSLAAIQTGGQLVVGGAVFTSRNSAPTAVANQTGWWFDPTNAATVINFTGKSADGTDVVSKLPQVNGNGTQFLDGTGVFSQPSIVNLGGSFTDIPGLPAGFTGTCTILGLTSITVVSGIVTGCS